MCSYGVLLWSSSSTWLKCCSAANNLTVEFVRKFAPSFYTLRLTRCLQLDRWSYGCVPTITVCTLDGLSASPENLLCSEKLTDGVRVIPACCLLQRALRNRSDVCSVFPLRVMLLCYVSGASTQTLQDADVGALEPQPKHKRQTNGALARTSLVCVGDGIPECGVGSSRICACHTPRCRWG